MFAKGDKVIYGTYGMCVVEDTDVTMSVGSSASSEAPATPRTYYLLVSESGRGGKAYVPKEKENLMRRIVKREEAEELVDGFGALAPDPFEDGNIRVVEEHFRSVLRQHDCREALRVIATMRSRISAQAADGRKPSEVYVRLLKEAEAQAYGELSAVLGMSEGELAAALS